MSADAGQAPSGGTSLDVGEILAVLRLRWRLILLFLAAVVTATMAYSFMVDAQYRATTIIRINPGIGQEFQVPDVYRQMQLRSEVQLDMLYQTELRILRSRRIREKVVEQYEKRGAGDSVGEKALGAMTQVSLQERTELVAIHVTDTDAERAAALANLTAEAFEEESLAVRRDAANDAKKWLDKRLDEYLEKIDEDQKFLFQYKQDMDVVDIEEGITALSARMESLNRSYGEISSERVLIESGLRTYQRMLADGRYEDLASMVDDPRLHAINEAYSQALSARADLSSRYGPKHPKIEEINARIEQLKEDLGAQAAMALDVQRARVDDLTGKEATLEAELDAVKVELLEKQRIKAEFDRKNSELERTRLLVEKMSVRGAELELSSRTQLSRVTVVEEATEPKKPVSPNKPVNLLLALMLGLLGGASLAFLIEYLDDAIRSPLDVSLYLKAPFLGLVPHADQEEGTPEAKTTLDEPGSTIAEAVRNVAAMVDLNPVHPRPEVLLVTSTLPSEGKTMTAIRLALAYARLGRRVLVVDCDLRRSKIHKNLQVPNDVGLSTVLTGEGTVAGCVQFSEEYGLYVLSAGPRTNRPHELLASEAMRALLDELREAYDLVILDTPPLAGLADVLVLANQVDGVLMVVRADKVSRRMAQETVELLRSIGVPLLGVVLNAVTLGRGRGARYYYKYSYGYGRYYQAYATEDGEGEARE